MPPKQDLVLEIETNFSHIKNIMSPNQVCLRCTLTPHLVQVQYFGTIP